MKYQSEIVKEIIDSRGHEKSSLHYQSECIETWIKETEGSYPKLCEYEGEWLNYINENPIGNFPYETFIGTDGTVNNVVPYAYKSAILTGQTLVNMLSISNTSISNNTGVKYKYNITPTIGKTYLIKLKINSIGETSSAYPVKIELFSSTDSKGYLDITSSDYVVGNEIIKTITAIDGNRLQSNSIVIWCRNLTSGIFDADITMFEYQNGMENWDIPYFTGMQSVKMPVLTTTGKNLWDKKNFVNGVIDGESIRLTAGDLNDTRFYYDFKENQQYVFTLTSYSENKKLVYFRYNYTDGTDSGYTNFLPCNGETKSFISSANKTILYISFIFSDNDNYTLSNVQFEEGSAATPYEPFKSNILSCLEPVELGSVGEVKDELNLLTQQLTQRTETRPYQEGDELNSEFVTDMTNTRYKLAQEVVKTVELTITNQDGQSLSKLKPIEGTMHISTSGNPFNPILKAEVPVEAITQNLASFIEE